MPMHSNPTPLFNEVIRLVNSGGAAAAEALCREALARNERDINVTALLGALLVKTGRYAESEAVLRRAIAMAPTFAKPHEDLGFVLLETSRPEDAVLALQEATRLDPSAGGAWFSLAAPLPRWEEARKRMRPSKHCLRYLRNVERLRTAGAPIRKANLPRQNNCIGRHCVTIRPM